MDQSASSSNQQKDTVTNKRKSKSHSQQKKKKRKLNKEQSDTIANVFRYHNGDWKKFLDDEKINQSWSKGNFKIAYKNC